MFTHARGRLFHLGVADNVEKLDDVGPSAEVLEDLDLASAAAAASGSHVFAALQASEKMIEEILHAGDATTEGL
jgi:hypothetical protein